MKKLITICAVIVLFGTSYAMAGWTTLDMPGATETSADGIDGSNIVSSYTDAYGEHGFLYNGTSWTTLDMPGATYTCANGIDGSNIVGQYWDASGSVHGFIYTIPEPATIALLGLGSLLLCRNRKFNKKQK